MIRYSANQLTELKPLKDIPDNIKKAIKLLSFPPTPLGFESGNPFGSYFNRSSKYYGDIDLIQDYVGIGSPEKVAKGVAKHTQKIVQNVLKLPDHFFSEIKAGLDRRYLFHIGEIVDGVFYISDELKPYTEELYRTGLLSETEYKAVEIVLNKLDRDYNDYDAIYNLFREHWILRWSADEILKGYKVVKGLRFDLWKTIFEHTTYKIDIQIIDSNNKFLEVTNFLALGYEKNGEKIPLNLLLTEDLELHALLTEIEKNYYSDMYYSPFKLVKRAFSVFKRSYKGYDDGLIAEHNWTNEYMEDMIQKLTSILNTTINILYTTRSELDAMKLILERNDISAKSSTMLKMNERLDMLLDPLSNVLELDKKELQHYSDLIKLCIKENNDKKKAEILDDIMSLMKLTINYHTIRYMNELGINPPPRDWLANDEIWYDLSIIRNPEDNPKNPLKELMAQAEGKKGGFFKSIAKKAFQKAANWYRRRNCEGKSRPLYNGEFHYGCHNYTGPGTRIDLPDVRAQPPYNNIDGCSRKHDLDYMRAIELPDELRKAKIREADEEVIKCYDKYPNENGYRVARLGINSKMKLENVIPIVARSVFGDIAAAGKKDKKTSDFLSI